jgi:DNA-binding HxlR family transcriptional regulator
VEYSLTPFGARVAAKLLDLIDLVEGEMPSVYTAQERYDSAKR